MPDPSPAPPLPIELNPPRCTRCYYVLTGLGEGGGEGGSAAVAHCPECGQEFIPGVEATYTRRPPFLFWSFWLPGILLAAGLGLATWLVLIPIWGYGGGVTLGVPLAMGALAGYGCRVGRGLTLLAAVVAVLAACIGLFTLQIAGVFCTLVIGAIALVPALVGALAGAYLRKSLKASNFRMRTYLPGVLILAVPWIWCAIEGRHDGLPLTTVRTVAFIDAPPDTAWGSILFYEEVDHPPPWLLRLPIWRPLYARGDSSRVGGIKVCVYTKGKLAKQVTELDPGKKLAFRVIQQKKIETEAVRLVGGSFTLEPLDGGRRTKVTLETSYVPLLTPRPAWWPFEAYAVHTLHGHVLEGMRRKAESAPERP